MRSGASKPRRSWSPGDLIDKGPSSVEVIKLLMALQIAATKTGGRVVVTLGNHEAEFLVDPNNAKASGPAGIDPELAAKGVSCSDTIRLHSGRPCASRRRAQTTSSPSSMRSEGQRRSSRRHAERP